MRYEINVAQVTEIKDWNFRNNGEHRAVHFCKIVLGTLDDVTARAMAADMATRFPVGDKTQPGKFLLTLTKWEEIGHTVPFDIEPLYIPESVPMTDSDITEFVATLEPVPEPMAPLPFALPTVLNECPVVEARDHGNGFATVMIDRGEGGETEKGACRWVVATWWPALGAGWSWGHYSFTRDHADADFAAVCERNAGRSS